MVRKRKKARRKPSRIKPSLGAQAPKDREPPQRSDYTKGNTIGTPDHNPYRGKANKMTVFLSIVSLAVFGLFASIAVANWQKGGLGNYWHAFGWGVVAYILFGFGAAFTYYFAIIKPAQTLNRPIPHVFFKSTGLKKPLTIGEKVTVEMVLTNNGSADTHVRFWDNTYVFQVKPFNDRLTYIPYPATTLGIAHGQDVNGEVRFDFVVTKEKLDALDSGNARLLFIARGEFGDGISTPVPLPFCRMYDKDIRGNLIFCPDAVTIASESSDPGNRASLVVQSADITVFEVGKRTEALVKFVNSGGMLAKNTRVYGHIQLRDKPLPADMPGAKDIGEEPSQDIVPPNGGTALMPIHSGSALTPHLMGLINKGTHQLYIWGIVTYEDLVGERWTKFCMIQYEKTMKLTMCPNNNETDQ